MYNIECVDNLVKNYNNIVRYPVLGLYVKDRNTFITNFIVIDENQSVSICYRKSTKMIVIDKSESEINIFKNKISRVKKVNKKIFSFGNLGLYKTQIAVIE